MLERDAISGGLYTGDATSLAQINKPFWAKLTSVSGGFYAWTEVYYEPASAAFITTPGGRFGTTSINPALEPNGVALTTPTFVRLQRAYFDTSGKDWVYLIVSGSGGGGSAFIKAGAVSATPNVFDSTLQTMNANATTFATGSAVWAYSWMTAATGKALVNGDIYVAFANGTLTVGGTNRLLYFALGPILVDVTCAAGTLTDVLY